MGKRGSVSKIQSIRFPKWMADAIEEIAEKCGYTFTDVVLDLLRQELAIMGYSSGLGREAAVPEITPKPIKGSDKSFLTRETSPAYGPEPSDEEVWLSYYGETAAGEPLDISNPSDIRIKCPRKLLKGDPSDYFALQIRGYSMTKAKISDGDRVLIRATNDPQEGKIMLVRYENRSTLKRLKKVKNIWILCWEDGSGKEVEVKSKDYQVQGLHVFTWKSPL